MAMSFAEEECKIRRITEIELRTGGTNPANEIHENVVEVMREVGKELGERIPRKMDDIEMASCDMIVTMGCSTLDTSEMGTEVMVWDLEDPGSASIEECSEVRNDIKTRVQKLFHGLEETGIHGRTGC